MRIAFYAPLKAPTHETPSGDRRMGRLLIEALTLGGHAVRLASDFRSFEGQGDSEVQARIAAAGRAEVDHLLQTYQNAKPETLPEIWFTYHLYYKAPDHLGPVIARALNIPYVVAEPSYAPKRAGGLWNDGHRAVGEALAQAAAMLCLTRHDMACVAPLIDAAGAPEERLRHLPPFLDAAPYLAAGGQRTAARQALAAQTALDPNKTWLIAVGMMRPGDKMESYRRLREALQHLAGDNWVGDDWQLITVGDGAMRDEVKALFDTLHVGGVDDVQRVVHLGAVDPEQMPATLAAADIFVWPAAGEAYGMAMLEAQACGVPVVAGNIRGVPEVVQNARTGLLVAENDPILFAQAIWRLMSDDDMTAEMRKAAQHFVKTERSVARAADILKQALKVAMDSAGGPP